MRFSYVNIVYKKLAVLSRGGVFFNKKSPAIANVFSVGAVGFEPTRGGFKGPCLTAWLHPNKKQYHVSISIMYKV